MNREFLEFLFLEFCLVFEWSGAPVLQKKMSHPLRRLSSRNCGIKVTNILAKFRRNSKKKNIEHLETI